MLEITLLFPQPRSFRHIPPIFPSRIFLVTDISAQIPPPADLPDHTAVHPPKCPPSLSNSDAGCVCFRAPVAPWHYLAHWFNCLLIIWKPTLDGSYRLTRIKYICFSLAPWCLGQWLPPTSLAEWHERRKEIGRKKRKSRSLWHWCVIWSSILLDLYVSYILSCLILITALRNA